MNTGLCASLGNFFVPQAKFHFGVSKARNRDELEKRSNLALCDRFSSMMARTSTMPQVVELGEQLRMGTCCAQTRRIRGLPEVIELVNQKESHRPIWHSRDIRPVTQLWMIKPLQGGNGPSVCPVNKAIAFLSR